MSVPGYILAVDDYSGVETHLQAFHTGYLSMEMLVDLPFHWFKLAVQKSDQFHNGGMLESPYFLANMADTCVGAIERGEIRNWVESRFARGFGLNTSFLDLNHRIISYSFDWWYHAPNFENPDVLVRFFESDAYYTITPQSALKPEEVFKLTNFIGDKNSQLTTPFVDFEKLHTITVPHTDILIDLTIQYLTKGYMEGYLPSQGVNED